MKASVAFLALLLFATGSHAGTIFVGLDDAVGVDYDYQDMVFSIAGNGLKVNSSARWNTIKPILTGTVFSIDNGGLRNRPFFNQTSLDGAKLNIGFCIWGGGNCNAGTGLAPDAGYLASDPSTTTGSANDVTFSASGDVTSQISLNLAGTVSRIGWYLTASPSVVKWLGPSQDTFTPAGDFGLVGYNPYTNGTFYTQTSFGTSDVVSHFSYFANVDSAQSTSDSAASTPEPATLLLMLTAMLSLGATARKTR